MRLYDFGDSHRPPDWRYLNANALLESGAASPAGLDRDTRRLIRFLRRLRSARTIQDRDRLLQDDRRTGRALALSRAGHAMGDTLKLWLLAGVLTEDAAMATRLPSEVVSVFVADHFDIADRLDNTSFILSKLVFETDSPRPDVFRRLIFRRLVAYLGGAETLSEVLHFGGRREDTNLEGFSNTVARRAGLLRRIKIHLAEESVDPMDLTAAPEALRLLECQEQVAARKDENSPPPTPHEEMIDAVLKVIPWSVRGTKDAKPHPRLAPFEDGPAELRAYNQLRIALGEDLFDPEEFKSRKLPPPRTSSGTNDENEQDE